MNIYFNGGQKEAKSFLLTQVLYSVDATTTIII